MNIKIETFLVILYVLNVGMCVYIENWTAVMGWACALLIQLRIMGVIKID